MRWYQSCFGVTRREFFRLFFATRLYTRDDRQSVGIKCIKSECVNMPRFTKQLFLQRYTSRIVKIVNVRVADGTFLRYLAI